MKKLYACIIIVLLCFLNVACSFVDSNNHYEKEEGVIKESFENVESETEIMTNSFEYEKCNQLIGTINMMVIYDFSYMNLSNIPNDEFWNKFSNSLLCNSWYDGYGYLAKEYGTTMWDNEKIAYAGSLLTGKELRCESFPEGLDLTFLASPYAHEWEQENISVEPLGNNRWNVKFDFVWLSCSIDTKKGKKEVEAVIIANKKSPFDGYSVESINIKTISEPEF